MQRNAFLFIVFKYLRWVWYYSLLKVSEVYGKQQVSHKPGKPGLGQAAMLPDLFNHQPSFSQEAKIKKTAEVNNCDGATLVSTADMIEYWEILGVWTIKGVFTSSGTEVKPYNREILPSVKYV